jgi:hypothetical protein
MTDPSFVHGLSGRLGRGDASECRLEVTESSEKCVKACFPSPHLGTSAPA